VPYLAWSADRTGATLELAYDGISVSRGKGETCVALADPAALLTDRTTAVRVRPVSCLTGTPLRRAYRCKIDPQDARMLATFAQRTYAPETEQGRLAGAGAGLTDND
jgi:hypothetical protein